VVPTLNTVAKYFAISSHGEVLFLVNDFNRIENNHGQKIKAVSKKERAK